MVSFEELDGLRRLHGFTREQVYERAKVSGETWRRTAAGRTSPTLRTLDKLRAALTALINEKDGEHGRA